jgi:hypothetical protein
MSKPGRRRRTSTERIAARQARAASERARREVDDRGFVEKVLGGTLRERLHRA